MTTELRKTGISVVGDVPWGTHFSLFCETKQDLLDTLVPYFKAGLENDEYCIWVICEPLTIQDATDALRPSVRDFDAHVTRRSIEIFPPDGWYLQNGSFDLDRVVKLWQQKLDQALATGYAGLRGIGNEDWLTGEYWKDFAEYEKELDQWIAHRRMIALCTYPLATISGVQVFDVARTHQFAIAKRHGNWQVLETPELIQAKAEIKRLNEELEQRVTERTSELVAANAALRREVAERQQITEALHTSEARLQGAMDAAGIGLWDWDLVSGQVTWLGHHEELFGFAPGEFDGTYDSFEKHVHPDDVEELRKIVQRAGDEGSEYAHEYRVRWPNGSMHWIAGRGRFTYGETGQPVRMMGAVLDISERKRAEEAIRKSEQVLREAESLGHTGSWEHDLVTGEIFNTEENLRLFFGDDRSKGTPFEDYAQAVHPDDREFVMRRHAQLLAEGGTRDIEFRVVWPDGSVHVLFGRATVVREESGQAIRVYGTNLDITERKRAEDALRRSEDHLRLVIETIPVMAWSVRTDGIVDFLNQRWMDYTGLSLEQYVEEPTRPIHPEDIPRVLQKWNADTAAGKPYEDEMRLQGADGEYRWFLVRTDPLRDESGNIVKWYAVSTDIDDRKRAEEEMNRQAARAETLARIAARLNKQLDLGAVIHAVCQEIIDTFQVSQATMSLYDKERDLLVYAGGVNIPPEYAASIEPITRSQFDDFLRTLGPIMVVPDIQAVPNVPNAEFSSQLDVRTVVTAAMLRGRELIGVLVLGVNGHVREFTKDELTLLKAISDEAAQAIANAQLLTAANEQHAQLRALSAKLVEAQETERRAIARELHDEIGQVLNAVSANLRALQLSPNQTTRVERLEESLHLIDEALRQVRDLSLDLRPSMLDDFGLVPALEWYIDRQAQRSGLSADFVAAPADLRLRSNLETTVFRVAQIALTNVARHAQAKNVRVELGQAASQVELLIRDDGVGFDVQSALERAARGASLGLLSMQERARLAGGELEIQSAPGQGTEIRAHFPMTERTTEIG